MLKGIEKNLNDNYKQIIDLKRKDQLKTKEDVPVIEAFELYMLKKFHKVKLNQLSNNMLNFWEKDFDKVIEKHINFLTSNLEYQDKYSSKFSKILQEMEIFQNEEKMRRLRKKMKMMVKITHQMIINQVMLKIKENKIKKRKVKQI